MASVIATVLKRKKQSGNGLVSSMGEPPVHQHVTRMLSMRANSKTMHGTRQEASRNDAIEGDKEDHAARTIQRTFRGYLLRQELKGLVQENMITNRSIVEALEIIARWHLGWSRFVIQCLVGAFLIVTVYFQIFYQKPSAYDVNTAFLTRLKAIPNGDGSAVTDPVEFYPFLSRMVHEFYTKEILDTPFCSQALTQFCMANSNLNDSTLEQVLIENCTLVEGGGLTYQDSTNRLIGASFVTQTRKATKKCLPAFSTLDDIIVGDQSSMNNKRKHHVCLDDGKEAKQFLVGTGCISPDCPPVNSVNREILSAQQDEFVFQPSPRSYFLFPLHIGLNRGLPYKAIQCKIDRVQRLGWVDDRTKNLCLNLGFFNKQDQGRLLSYKECFDFRNSGRVHNTREVASTSLYADPTVALVMTWILIGLIFSKQVFDLILFFQERRAIKLGKRGRVRQPLTIRSIVALIPSILILAGCIIFLVLVYVISDTKTVATTEDATLDEFISTLTQADWAVSLWVAYTTVMSVALLIMLGKTLSLLDFHPTSAIVSGTLKRASGGLGCFFLLYALVLLGYAFVGMMLLGRSRYEFSTFGLAINALLFTAVGEMQRMQDIIFYEKIDAEYVSIIQALYFWSYVLLVTILLMNLLLSIIVGSFVEMQEKKEKSLDSRPILSFSRSFWTSLHFWFGGFRVYTQRMVMWFRYCCCCCCNPTNVPRKVGWCCKRPDQPQQEEIKAPSLKNKSMSVRTLKKIEFSLKNARETVENEDYPLTPWEKLLAFPREYVSSGGGGHNGTESTAEARKKLEAVFKNEQTAEYIILWCRAHTRMQKIQRYGYHLRGLDPDSEAVKGQTVYMLESIMKKMGSSNANFRMASNKSVISSATKSSKNEDSAEQRRIEEEEEDVGPSISDDDDGVPKRPVSQQEAPNNLDDMERTSRVRNDHVERFREIDRPQTKEAEHAGGEDIA